jgi:hypothetical protein
MDKFLNIFSKSGLNEPFLQNISKSDEPEFNNIISDYKINSKIILVNNWKLFCQDENKTIYIVSDEKPISCPYNSSHKINSVKKIKPKDMIET